MSKDASIKSNIEEKSSLESLKRIEVDDIQELLLEKPSNIKDVGLYGVRYQLKCFAGLDSNIILNKCTIEHGLMMRKYVCQMEVQHHVACLLTYSPYREEVIRELTDLKPLAIGPYIAYAEDYRTERFMAEKKHMLGRVLLIMPIHSIQGIKTTYSYECFFREIEMLKINYDTVWVCLYIEDLRRGLWKLYEKQGYKVVSAGYRDSPYFLSRLKYILSLSDAVVLNEYSTGMSYAMYMRRPIHLIREEITYHTTCNNNSYQLENKNNEEMYKLFYNDQFAITDDQIRFGKYMFGLECIKTKKEMKDLLLSLSRTAR